MDDERGKRGAFIRKAMKTNCKIGYKIDLDDGGKDVFDNLKLIHSDPEKQKSANDLTILLKNEILSDYTRKKT